MGAGTDAEGTGGIGGGENGVVEERVIGVIGEAFPGGT